MKGNWSIHNKQLLKGAYHGEHLPKEILNRAKTGWRFTTDELLIGRNTAAGDTLLREWVKEILSDRDIQNIFEIVLVK